MNMIVHRDYMHHGDSSIKIFDNRIEFFNPGGLPRSISIENLRKGTYVSDCRNKLIAFAFKEIGWIEKYGSGIKRITEAFRKHGCDLPVFDNFQHGFRVVAYSLQKNKHQKVVEKVVENLSQNQQTIIQLISKNKYISALEMAGIIGISQRKTQENIKKLKEMGIISRIGSNKGGHWEIVGKE